MDAKVSPHSFKVVNSLCLKMKISKGFLPSPTVKFVQTFILSRL